MKNKTILFITNNFPPIVDGVGDYTYKLAQALGKQGVEVSILCSSKPDIIENIKVFEAEGINVFPIVNGWDFKGMKVIQNVFKNEKYDLISLQYVPFSFQNKGLPIRLGGHLKTLFPDTNWHIMFHELWVGMGKNAIIKSKIHGYLQKQLISSMIKQIKPSLINTHCHLYKWQLNKIGFDVTILPLFSNIQKTNKIIKPKGRAKEFKTMVFSVFGSIHFGAPVKLFIKELSIFLDKHNGEYINAKFIFIGNCGAHLNEWVSVLKENNIDFEITGKLSEISITKHLNSTNFGITTTPYILVEKSGTVAAMLEHNLNVSKIN